MGYVCLREGHGLSVILKERRYVYLREMIWMINYIEGKKACVSVRMT